jgi:hypothetical protein
MVVPPVPLLHSSRVFPRIDSDNRNLQCRQQLHAFLGEWGWITWERWIGVPGITAHRVFVIRNLGERLEYLKDGRVRVPGRRFQGSVPVPADHLSTKISMDSLLTILN